jgi:hypothetical protein
MVKTATAAPARIVSGITIDEAARPARRVTTPRERPEPRPPAGGR